MRGPFICARWLLVIGLVVLSTSKDAVADSKPPPDLRSCVCNGISDAPRDLFTARRVVVDQVSRLEVVEVIAHGERVRQVPGERVVGGPVFLNTGCESGPCFVYEAADDTFCMLPIGSFDLERATRRTLSCNVQPGDFYDQICTTEFSLSQLKPFMNALAADKGTCQALATKYLGIPVPSDEGQCGGGTSPGWLVLEIANSFRVPKAFHVAA